VPHLLVGVGQRLPHGAELLTDLANAPVGVLGLDARPPVVAEEDVGSARLLRRVGAAHNRSIQPPSSAGHCNVKFSSKPQLGPWQELGEAALSRVEAVALPSIAHQSYNAQVGRTNNAQAGGNRAEGAMLSGSQQLVLTSDSSPSRRQRATDGCGWDDCPHSSFKCARIQS